MVPWDLGGVGSGFGLTRDRARVSLDLLRPGLPAIMGGL